jgi:hypothetical protein
MLTHDFLAQMLGVRRTTVTEASIKIEAAGAIVCSRGVIKIIDPEAVKALSCECYETLRGQTSVSCRGGLLCRPTGLRNRRCA